MSACPRPRGRKRLLTQPSTPVEYEGECAAWRLDPFPRGIEARFYAERSGLLARRRWRSKSKLNATAASSEARWLDGKSLISNYIRSPERSLTSIRTRSRLRCWVILLSIEQLIKLFGSHPFELCLKRSAVTAVVRFLTALRLASILSHESTNLGSKLFLTLVHCNECAMLPNARAEWCRANDSQTQTEARTRHPLQHDS